MRENQQILTKGNPFLTNTFTETIDNGIVSWEQLLKGFANFESTGIFDPENNPLLQNDPAPALIIERVAFINDELIARLKKDPEQIWNLSPRKFEELIADLLANQGFDVDLTPASRDGGFDIYAARNDGIGKFLYLVECKKYTPPNKVGVQVVRGLHGVVQKERANAGIVVTSSYFTSPAKEFQSELEYQMKLNDYINLQNWLGVI